MTDIPKPSDGWHKPIGRRRFLRASAEAAVAAGTIFLFGGCTSTRQPVSPAPERFPPPTVPAAKTPEGLPVPIESEIQTIAKISVEDTNRILGLTLSSEDVAANLRLVTNLDEYQRLLASDSPSYEPSDELDRPGITSHENGPNGKKIFLFAPAIAYINRQLPNNATGKQVASEFIESAIDHELIHYSAPLYDSPELFALTYGKMFANLPVFKGKDIKPMGVAGAIIYAEVEGRPVALYQKLEEAEAIVTSGYVFENRGRELVGSIPGADDTDYVVQITLLQDLLRKLNPNTGAGIKDLAKLRTQIGGREKFCRQIGDAFNVKPEEQLFFALTVLYAIDTADTGLYRNVTTIANR